MSKITTSAAEFVSEIEVNPILEISDGKLSIISSLISTVKLSAFICETGKTFSVDPIFIIKSVKLISESVLLYSSIYSYSGNPIEGVGSIKSSFITKSFGKIF